MEYSKIKFKEIKLSFEAEPNIAFPNTRVLEKDVEVNYPLKDENKKGVILFKDVLMYRVGSPNDEGFYGFGFQPNIKNDSIYSKKNFPTLEFGNFYQVEGVNWKSDLLGRETVT